MEARYSSLEVFICCVKRIMMFDVSWVEIYRAYQHLQLNSLLFNFFGFCATDEYAHFVRLRLLRYVIVLVYANISLFVFELGHAYYG